MKGFEFRPASRLGRPLGPAADMAPPLLTTGQEDAARWKVEDEEKRQREEAEEENEAGFRFGGGGRGGTGSPWMQRLKQQQEGQQVGLSSGVATTRGATAGNGSDGEFLFPAATAAAAGAAAVGGDSNILFGDKKHGNSRRGACKCCSRPFGHDEIT